MKLKMRIVRWRAQIHSTVNKYNAMKVIMYADESASIKMLTIVDNDDVFRRSICSFRYRHEDLYLLVGQGNEAEISVASSVAAEEQSSIKCLFVTLNGNDFDGIASACAHFTNGAHVIIIFIFTWHGSHHIHMNNSLANERNAERPMELMNSIGHTLVLIVPLPNRNKTNKMLLVVQLLPFVRIYCHFRRISYISKR